MKGHIRQRGKHSWAIVIDIGYDSSGYGTSTGSPVAINNTAISVDAAGT